MEDDGFLSDCERETILPPSHVPDVSALTVHSTAELIKTKKWGSELKPAKKPRTLLAGIEDVHATQTCAALILHT